MKALASCFLKVDHHLRQFEAVAPVVGLHTVQGRIQAGQGAFDTGPAPGCQHFGLDGAQPGIRPLGQQGAVVTNAAAALGILERHVFRQAG